jgi:hypothetical protein
MELHPDRPGDSEAARRFEALTAADAQLTTGEDARLQQALERVRPNALERSPSIGPPSRCRLRYAPGP